MRTPRTFFFNAMKGGVVYVMTEKSGSLKTFLCLSSKQQKAIVLLVTTRYTQKKIATEISVRPQTISEWKMKDDFKNGMIEYTRHFVSDLSSPAAKTLKKLLNAKSEMVQLQAVQLVFSMAGIGTVDRNPELEAAQIRKANAEARIVEQKANEIEGVVPDDVGKDNFIEAIDKGTDKIWSEDHAE